MWILSLSIFPDSKHVGESSEALRTNFSPTAKSKALAFDGAANLAAKGCSRLTRSGNSFARRWRQENERARAAKKKARRWNRAQRKLRRSISHVTITATFIMACGS
jgi:hypothetical protein